MSASVLSPDLILTNATVLTADAANSRAEAVAVYGGKIGAVGSASDIDAIFPIKLCPSTIIGIFQGTFK